MKKIALMAVAFLLFGLASKAQCNKTIKWTAPKIEYIDTSGNVRSEDQIVTVTTGNGKVLVIAKNGEEEMKGDIANYSCNWNSTNGKMQFKSELTDKRGKLRHATITIESKEGKTTILMEAQEEQTKLRLPVDTYEAVN